VEKFLDTPVKRYSSGMYVRLAFAVAAHLEPEILIVDEVLAVGDAEFQKKCLGKMEDVATKQGRTVLFVSHHTPSVQRLCSRGILLQGGQVEKIGPINEVIDRYLAVPRADTQGRRRIEVAEGTCKITGWHIVNADGSTSHSCASQQTARIHMSIESRREIPRGTVGFVIRNLAGDLLIAANSTDDYQKPMDIPYGVTWVMMTVRLPLKMGLYQVELAVADEAHAILDFWAAEPHLSITQSRNSILSPDWYGLINEPVAFEVCG
jgi:lipopolysaccharide transport system ATP-binding protein